MKILEIINESEELIQWIEKQINGLEIFSEERIRLAPGCLDMALEHQKAIVLLVANKLYGSAFALARLIFEAYVRGIWLQLCASEEEVEKFKKDGVEKMFDTLVREIERCDGFNGGILLDTKAKIGLP